MTPLLDVNILMYAHRGELPRHAEAKKYLDDLRYGEALFGVPELACSALVRIVTAPKPFVPPSSTQEALDFCHAIISSPQCLLVRPSENHWSVFDQLCRRVNARGKLVPDVYFAALAIDQNYMFVTTDSDYAKFPGLAWRELGELHARTNPR